MKSVDGLTARLIFCVQDRSAVLLHGFIKKTEEIDLAPKRKRQAEP